MSPSRTPRTRKIIAEKACGSCLPTCKADNSTLKNAGPACLRMLRSSCAAKKEGPQFAPRTSATSKSESTRLQQGQHPVPRCLLLNRGRLCPCSCMDYSTGVHSLLLRLVDSEQTVHHSYAPERSCPPAKTMGERHPELQSEHCW